MRAPRKIKKKIPNGMYCYTGIKYDISTGIYHIKPCPFYSRGLSLSTIESQVISINRGRKIESINNEAGYVEMKIEDHPFYFESISGNGGWCRLKPAGGIEDQCKGCGIKMDYKGESRRRSQFKLKKKSWKNKI